MIKVFIVLTVLLFVCFIGCAEPEENPDAASAFPELSGPYLGQKPPGLTPELFAPGVVNTPYQETSCSFSADGKTLAFGYGGHSWGIVYMEEINGKWTEPKVAPFSGEYWDFDFSFAPTGNTFLFSTNRSDPDRKIPSIWVVERSGNGWSEARHIGEPFGADVDYHHASMARNGNLYFFSNREGSYGSGDVWRSLLVNGKYQEPENLGPNINSEEWEGDVVVSPDEEYLIFVAGRPDGYGDADMYISFRTPDDSWTKAVNMGPAVNSATVDVSLSISPDGKYFFFFSDRENLDGYPQYELKYQERLLEKQIILDPEDPVHNGDVYWVSTKIIEQFKPE